MVNRAWILWVGSLFLGCASGPANPVTDGVHPGRFKDQGFVQAVDEPPLAPGFDIDRWVKTTPLKNQQSSGTCWSFATTSFIETEAIRLGHRPVSLSPIFYVTPTYLQKAEQFIERKGQSFFDPGDLTFSVMDAYEKVGAVPETAYDGVIEGEWQHDHVEMDNLLAAMVASVGRSGYGRIKPQSWRDSVRAVLKAYIGEAPSSFTFDGATHSPQSFAETFVGIDPQHYVEVTSFTHLPMNRMVVLNVPANWRAGEYLNIPLADFERLVDHALDHGFSLAWDGDASEPGFMSEKGTAVLPSASLPITAEQRQTAFESGATSDDHNLHLVGRAFDAQRRPFYVLKNSEGPNARGGYMYMSKAYLLMKTISLLVHRDALPPDVRARSSL